MTETKMIDVSVRELKTAIAALGPEIDSAILGAHKAFAKLSQTIDNFVITYQKQMPELKPCPFCGGDVVVHESKDSQPTYDIHCQTKDCYVSGNEWDCIWEHPDKAVLIEMWNTRATSIGDQHDPNNR